MTFNPVMFETTRSEVHQHFIEYERASQLYKQQDGVVVTAKNKILEHWYYELLILQSTKKYWEILMSDPSLNFRRQLCAKLYNLQRVNFEEELNLTSGAVSNLFNGSTMPKWPRPFQLSVFFNHPWQLINYGSPDPYSFQESPEYFEEKVSKKIPLSDLSNERTRVSSIRGYVIVDAQKLFPQESSVITGRWVTTYPEFDFFEFHLNSEPLVDNVLRADLLKFFPLAEDVITTYRPFKPSVKRALWVIIPKNKTLPSYAGMIHELKVFREYTEFHALK
ncbi:hypothetical protein [Paenibacillus odorifer]|uniref:hypothetical protein n=1 Tax=Paenibacillus odorifer TaxID=189426 RepID=UPI00096F9801|nr:hypothetical protein [Paenibacillus odorifer]OMD92780.1 hypothetical protein BSK67_18635 [Paenibacillus odorifer]